MRFCHLHRKSGIPQGDQILRDLQGNSQVLQILTIVDENCIVVAAQETHASSPLRNAVGTHAPR